jgi:hypothetical protein
LPFYDESTRIEREKRKQAEIEAIKAKHSALKRRKDDSWWRNYRDHLASEKWRQTRDKVLSRGSGVCEGCGERKATDAHHLSYLHVGNEFLFELAAVCNKCHRRLHPPEVVNLEDLPCWACRFQAIKGTVPFCTKFEEFAFDALAADGQCGPNALERVELQ